MLDVRNDDEREDPGRIPGSLHVPRKFNSRKFALRKCSGKLVTIIKKCHFEIRLHEIKASNWVEFFYRYVLILERGLSYGTI